jgi:hypothetical protein
MPISEPAPNRTSVDNTPNPKVKLVKKFLSVPKFQMTESLDASVSTTRSSPKPWLKGNELISL